MRFLLSALLSCFAFAATAGHFGPIADLPMLYEVTGVASDDVLNVRAEASVGSEIVGSLAADQTNVEVIAVSDDGRWGLVNARDQAGWVALHFMRDMDEPFWWELSRPLYCYGTEPFWSARITGAVTGGIVTPGGITIDVAGEPLNYLPGDWLPDGWGNVTWGQPAVAVANFADGTKRATATMLAQSCSDGMSDFEYGITIHLVMSQHDQGDALANQIRTGCCSIIGP